MFRFIEELSAILGLKKKQQPDSRISFSTGYFGGFYDEGRLELVECYKSFLEKKLGDLLSDGSHKLEIEENDSKDESGRSVTKYKLLLVRGDDREEIDFTGFYEYQTAERLREAYEKDYNNESKEFLKLVGGRKYSFPIAETITHTIYSEPLNLLYMNNSSDAQKSSARVKDLMDNIEANLPKIREELEKLNKLSRYEIEGMRAKDTRKHYNSPPPGMMEANKYSLILELSHREETSPEALAFALQYEKDHPNRHPYFTRAQESAEKAKVLALG